MLLYSFGRFKVYEHKFQKLFLKGYRTIIPA